MKKQNFKKNIQTWIFAGITCLGTFFANSQTNPIVSPSFEEASSAWVLTSQAKVISGNAHDGNFALQLTDGGRATQTITRLMPWSTYQLSCYVSSSVSGRVQLGIRRYGGNEILEEKTTISYTEIRLKFTTGPATTSAIIYCTNPRDIANTVFVDNFSIVKLDENPYSLVWSDEFNGTGLTDNKNWNHESGFIRSNQPQFYTRRNAVQKDGNLVITSNKSPVLNTIENPAYDGSSSFPGNVRWINYTSSSINTKGKHSWLYGRIEVRAKIRNKSGARPAIWTLGEDTNCDWPSNGEIDIMENYRNTIPASYAIGTDKPWVAKWWGGNLSIDDLVAKDPEWLSKFHIWTLDWDYNKLTVHVDGDYISEVDLNLTFNGPNKCGGENPFRKKQYLILNQSLPGDCPTCVAETVFPSEFVIDYARVYQLTSSLAVQKPVLAKELTIFPNPVKNELNINYPTNDPKYKLFDVIGRTIMSGKESKIDVSKLIPGMYFIQVEDLQATKFIKE